MKTLRDAAQAALDVQSACNLSGVVHSFSKAISILHAQPDFAGTDWVKNHPISVLFAAQIANLTGVAVIASAECDYGSCYWKCKALADHEVDEKWIQESAP